MPIVSMTAYRRLIACKGFSKLARYWETKTNMTSAGSPTSIHLASRGKPSWNSPSPVKVTRGTAASGLKNLMMILHNPKIPSPIGSIDENIIAPCIACIVFLNLK
uniref:Uncharacterized protein n=1 Tax=Opuntia streptacantha TaxID=393608 RepID=A0A7C8YW65_OPUST